MKLEIKPIFVIQKSDSMAGKAKTEIACSLSWFKHWDAHQRQEFGKLLIEKDQATNQDTSDESIESLLLHILANHCRAMHHPQCVGFAYGRGRCGKRIMNLTCTRI